jgi:hypothetical protein
MHFIINSGRYRLVMSLQVGGRLPGLSVDEMDDATKAPTDGLVSEKLAAVNAAVLKKVSVFA